jgi:hypothetical protein
VESQSAETGAGEANSTAEPPVNSPATGPPVQLTVGPPVQEITDLPQSASGDAPRMYGVPRSRLVFRKSGVSPPADAQQIIPQ